VLILIDIQRDYFPDGNLPLVGADAAADRAATLLGHFRDSGLPVIHVRHESAEADATFLAVDTAGAEFDPRVAPSGGETVITKRHPNAFLETDLRAQIDPYDGAPLVVAGMMTSMCVDATVRAASDLGYSVTVAAD
ncbi:isochorismatase family protein, partial [Escherichia coli]|uniref:isochorismatase family protein n=1 Tax=Escherichia coli TaxID=562 RepID=UPI0021584AE8